MCSSLDANSYESVNGDDCRKCEHLLDNAAMVQAKEAGRNAPSNSGLSGCSCPIWNLSCSGRGHQLHGVMALLSRFKFNKSCWNAKKTAIDFHRFKVAAFSQEQKTKAGSAWVIKFGEITPFSDANFEKELYLTSAQMLGQGNVLIPEHTTTEKEDHSPEAVKPVEAAVIAPPKVEPVKAPKINVITPKTPLTQTGKSTPSKIELDI
jgi:hypothetical protein